MRVSCTLVEVNINMKDKDSRGTILREGIHRFINFRRFYHESVEVVLVISADDALGRSKRMHTLATDRTEQRSNLKPCGGRRQNALAAPQRRRIYSTDACTRRHALR
jgi:hypothetical protein